MLVDCMVSPPDTPRFAGRALFPAPGRRPSPRVGTHCSITPAFRVAYRLALGYNSALALAYRRSAPRRDKADRIVASRQARQAPRKRNRTVSITVRPFEASDYPLILDIYERAAPLGLHPPLADVPNAQRCVAVDARTNEVIGFGAAPLRDRSSLEILVSPPWQRQGIGCLLWERLAEDLAAINATAVELWVREENAPAIAWLQKQGFVQIKQDGPVSLFPREADLSHFDATVAAVAMQGIVLTTLTRERQEDRDCLAKLHALYNAVNADVPGSEDHAAQSLED